MIDPLKIEDLNELAKEALRDLNAGGFYYRTGLIRYMEELCLFAAYRHDTNPTDVPIEHAQVFAEIWSLLIDLESGSRGHVSRLAKSFNRPGEPVEKQIYKGRIIDNIAYLMRIPEICSLSGELKFREIAKRLRDGGMKISWKEVRSLWSNRKKGPPLFKLIANAHTLSEIDDLSEREKRGLIVADILSYSFMASSEEGEK